MPKDKNDYIPKWKSNKRKYSAAYNKENMQDMILHFNKKTEADLINYLSIVPNKNGYIKQLIRDDMKKFDGYVE